MLRACGMQALIAFLVVGFLKEDIRSDAGFFEQAVIIDCRSRNINIDTADRAVFMFDAVDRLDTFSTYSIGSLTGSSPVSSARRLCPIS